MEPIAPWYYLGYIIPHPYTDLDAYQFYRTAPEGMVLVTTQLNLRGYDLLSVENELGTLWQRIDLLSKRGVDRIAISGVPLAAMLGRENTLKLLKEAMERGGIPCDTDMESHIAAMRHLGIKRIVLATRWPDTVNEAVIRYLAGVGIEVLACRSLRRSMEQNKAPDAAKDHEVALDLGGQLLKDFPDAEGLMMPGGPWFLIYVATMLETKFGRPVFLNITATTWAALHHDPARIIKKPGPAWSRLLATL